MHITKDTAVTLSYQLTTPQGKLLDKGHMAYLHGGYENIFPKVESALEGQAAGYAVTLDLDVDEALGERDERLVRTSPKSEFPPCVKVGGQLRGPGPDGHPQAFNVVKIKGAEVHLDGNHPLAGISLRLRLKVVDVRDARVDEVGRGSAGTGFFRLKAEHPAPDSLQ